MKDYDDKRKEKWQIIPEFGNYFIPLHPNYERL